MKLGIFVILIGVLAVFMGLSLVEPEVIEPELSQVEVLDMPEIDSVETKDEIVEVVEVVEEPKVEIVEEQVKEPLVVEKEIEVVADVPVVEVAEEPEVEEVPAVSFSTINEVTREALVNVFCTTKSGGSFKPTTGSGVIIDERGVILTNAHVAQYYLLEDYLVEDFVSCVIRTDSPASPEDRFPA